ncbi:MAG TPA: glycoside hydrolase domain-containing protein [Trebonia sp.]|nr:glycoside hydrolase domain-containing protein [Trebonia sp.]
MRKISLARGRAAAVSLFLLAGLVAPVLAAGPASASLPGPVVVRGEGFDTSSLPPTSDMGQWWTSTPYTAIGVYLGGDNSGGQAPNHSWLSNPDVMGTSAGWAVWLIWVGQQSACANQGGLASFSNNPGTATSQGEQQASAAVSAAKADGFANATIYYDLEAYDTGNSTCVTAAQSFINGFEYEVHTVLGFHGAVYGSSCGSDLQAYTAHSNVPEAIYPADWGYSDYATTPIQCISNTSWDHDQRIHQWSGDTALRFLSGHSGPGWTIDEDCLDASANGSTGWNKACH